MKLLHRYLLKQNMILLLACLGIGLGTYILADLFDRLDDFIEAGLGINTIGTYFLVKIPLIISQILPAVFLLAVLLQLGLMVRSREMLALQAGGIAFGRLVMFFVLYSLVMSLVQLAFSQMVGVYGEREAGRIWKEDVRKRQMDRRILENVWLKEGRYVVKLDKTTPSRQNGEGITVYLLAEQRMAWERIIRAQTFQGSTDGWNLENVEILDPSGFVVEKKDNLELPLHLDLKAFVAMDPHRDPTQLPLWQLGQVIQDLRVSGSNVESLRTVFHWKISYAFSLLVMGLLALSLSTMQRNIYFNVMAGLVLTFSYYGLTIVFVSAGQKGFIPPFVAAWTGNAVFCFLAMLQLLWHGRRRAATGIEA